MLASETAVRCRSEGWPPGQKERFNYREVRRSRQIWRQDHGAAAIAQGRRDGGTLASRQTYAGATRTDDWNQRERRARIPTGASRDTKKAHDRVIPDRRDRRVRARPHPGPRAGGPPAGESRGKTFRPAPEARDRRRAGAGAPQPGEARRLTDGPASLRSDHDPPISLITIERSE